MCCKKQPFGTAFQSKPRTCAPVFVSMIPEPSSRNAASLKVMVLAISLMLASPGESLSQSNESPNMIQLERFLVRGLTFMRTGYPDKASVMFSEGLRIHPTHPALLASMADAQQALGDFTSALFYMSGALQARPDNIDLHQQAYLLALESGDTESSLIHSTQILRLSPSDVNAFTRHIELLMALNRKSMAAGQAQQAVSLFRGEEDLLRTAIRAFESVGDLENAAISSKNLVGVTQEPADRHALAMVLMRAGRWEEAAEELILVLNEESDHREALASLLALQASLPERNLSKEIEPILALTLDSTDDIGPPKPQRLVIQIAPWTWRVSCFAPKSSRNRCSSLTGRSSVIRSNSACGCSPSEVSWRWELSNRRSRWQKMQPFSFRDTYPSRLSSWSCWPATIG